MLTKTPTSGSIGWTVVSEPGPPDWSSQLGGHGPRRRWKWQAFSPEGGSWGWSASQEKATENAREEFARLTGGEG